jgi:hypothetical protein
MKHLNTILLVVIVIVVLILIYRWYNNSFEGFLTNDDNLLTLTDVSTYDYLWSNNLLLEQYKDDDTKPKNLVILQKPKISYANGKILGSMIATNLEDINKKSISVSKDVRIPVDLEEIVSLKPESDETIEPVFNKLLTFKELSDNVSRNEAIVTKLRTSLTDIESMFNAKNINTKLKNKYYITLYTNYLGDNTKRDVSLTKNDNGDMSLSYSETSGFNAISFPVGSKVTITKKGRGTSTFYIPADNITDDNDTFIEKDKITYDTIFANSSGNLTEHTYNPFGMYGLGYKNYDNTNVQLYKNNNRQYNYNYTIEDNGIKSALSSYIKDDNLISKCSSLTNECNNCYIEIDNNLYFVKHVVEIVNNDDKYEINETRDIIRNVYTFGSKKGRISRGKCFKKHRFNDFDIGKTNFIRCKNENEKLLHFDKLGCAGTRRGYCINNHDYIGQNTTENEIIYHINVNREWINKDDYNSSYKGTDYDSDSGTFKCYIKFGSRTNVTNIDDDKAYPIEIPKNNTADPTYDFSITSSDNDNVIRNAINGLFNMKKEQLFDTFKRNILACLWRDGEVVFENKDGSTNNNDDYIIEFNKILFNEDNITEGPIYSPYVIFAFDNKTDAKYYVANILNKIHKGYEDEKKVVKFKTPTITPNVIDLLEFSDLRSESGRTISQIQKDINDVLDNFSVDDNSLKDKDDEIAALKTAITNSISSFNTKLKIYNINLMMSMPIYKSGTNGKEQEYINLFNGNHPINYEANKIESITVEMMNDPISNLISSNIINITTQINKFISFFNTNGNKYAKLKRQIDEKSLNHYPLTIHRPIAPKGYKALGDIVEVTGYTDKNSSYLYNINPKANIEEYGCVPEQCVVEVRPWLVSDKVFEYYSVGVGYFALFRNPYLNTFRATKSKNVLPDGGVEKIVACVAKSGIIDDLKKADKCANEYKRGYEQVVKGSNLDRDSILYDKQEASMLSSIAERQDTITKLKQNLKQMQHQDRQAIIINHSINRKKFQDLLDKQTYNMDKLITNLYSIISININMGELISKLREKGITINKIEEIISTIKSGKKIYSNTPTTTAVSGVSINQVNEQNGEGGVSESGLEPDSHIAEPVKLQRIIYKTQDGREQEMILRSLVEASCGCYFTDEEVLKTR